MISLRRARFSLVLIALTALCAPMPPASADPTPFPDAHDQSAWPGQGPIRVFPWMSDNRSYFWSRRDKDQDAVVFAGDSQVGNWKQQQMSSMLSGIKVVNRGIGGDVTRGLLFRLKEDVLDLHPKAIVLCIGTNDLSAKAPVQGIVDNIRLMVDQIRNYSAEVPVVLCLLPPRASEKAPISADSLLEFNERLKAAAGEMKNVATLDLYAALANPEGAPDPQYFGSDLLHINVKGREKWADLVKPILAKFKVD